MFLLVSPEHGLKRSDEQMLSMLRHNNIPHQVILSKVDRVLLPKSKTPTEDKMLTYVATLKKTFEEIRGKIQPEIEDGPAALGEILTCSAEKSLGSREKLGINRIRWAVLAATGLGLQERNLYVHDDVQKMQESEQNVGSQ